MLLKELLGKANALLLDDNDTARLGIIAVIRLLYSKCQNHFQMLDNKPSQEESSAYLP